MPWRMRAASLVCLASLVAGCQTPPAPSARQDIPLALESQLIEDRVPRDATLERLLLAHGVPMESTVRLIDAVREVFNPRQLRAGRPYRLTQRLDGVLQEFRYEIDADRFLRVVAADRLEPAFDVEVVEYPKEIVLDAVTGSITRERPSLIAAMTDLGEGQLLALELANAFGGLVDFNSDLQPGDRFRVLFDRVLRSGEFSGYGELRAAVMDNDGRRLTAVPFTVDGKLGWYDEQGRSLKRFFLPSPLRFQPSVSSGFNLNRRHPVTGNFSAHPAIDYRAAYGEPVLAVAAGDVTFAAVSGGSGRLVRIRHKNGYETMYLHLSRFAVKRGQHVAQGQVIGYVGNSGLVTGTHLDFRMRQNGQYKNPILVFRSLPPGDPIPKDLMPAFFAERDRLFQELDGRLTATSRNANRPNNNH